MRFLISSLEKGCVAVIEERRIRLRLFTPDD